MYERIGEGDERRGEEERKREEERKENRREEKEEEIKKNRERLKVENRNHIIRKMFRHRRTHERKKGKKNSRRE